MRNTSKLEISEDSPLVIRHYRPEDKRDFVELNLNWIQEYFAVEATDREQLEQLEETILGRGGRIIVAELDGRVVGAGALQPPPFDPQDGRTWIEIIKLATEVDHRGKGIGRRVMEKLISEAKQLGGNAIWLETNDVLRPAIRLYELIGFHHLPIEEFWPTPYQRCNVQMVLHL